MRDWKNFFTIPYEETIKKSNEDKKIDEKEALEFKKIYIHYLYKRREILTSTKFQVKVAFNDVKSKDSFSPEQITKLNEILAKKSEYKHKPQIKFFET